MLCHTLTCVGKGVCIGNERHGLNHMNQSNQRQDCRHITPYTTIQCQGIL
jgi:hypothetical protein